MITIRYAFRSLMKSRGFTAVAVLTLAAGIGAATCIFSVVDAVLFAPLPYPHPEQLVRVWERGSDGRQMNFGEADFDDFHDQNDTFAALADYGFWNAPMSGGKEPVSALLARVSDDFFRTFGVEPAIGRSFAPDELRIGGPRVIVVSHGYWKRYLGATADLSHVRLSIGDEVYPVIGVMPSSFDYPSGVDGWIVRKHDPVHSRRNHNWRTIGRLRSGVTVAQARANLSAIAGRIKTQYGKDADVTAADIDPLLNVIVGDVRKALLTLFGAVALLLLVGCANVAGLMLARTSARAKELAVRTALGASRIRILKQFLAEALVLSAMSGIAGIVIAVWSVRLLPAILPASIPRHEGIAVNLSVLLFAVAVTIAAAIALALFSSWRASAADLQQSLTAGSRSYTASRSTQRMRTALVIGQIATTLTILMAAGLLGRSFLRLAETSPGFRSENLITIEFLPPAPPGAQVTTADVQRDIQRVDRIAERLRAVPGVETAAVVGALPVANGDNLPDGKFVIVRGRKPPADHEEFEQMIRDPSQTGRASYCPASEAYFRTLGIPLIRGRLFSDSDTWDSMWVAVISAALARQCFPNEDPIGQVISFPITDGNLKPMTIVGIAGDIRAEGLDKPASPIIYTDYRQRGAGMTPTVIIRSTAAPGGINASLRTAFRDVAPEMPLKISTFEAELGGWLAQRRFVLFLVALFAVVTLGLAALGIYGVIAFSVARRTQEIGIRMAFGAQPADVLRLVLGEGARMASAGIVFGVIISLSITHLMSSLLFGVRPTDPWTIAAVSIMLIAVALLASYVPARRAMRIAPEVALRYE